MMHQYVYIAIQNDSICVSIYCTLSIDEVPMYHCVYNITYIRVMHKTTYCCFQAVANA